MPTHDNDMSDGMAAAIREIVNYARFDEQYMALSRHDRPDPTRFSVFEHKLGEVAAYNAIDKDELRDWLKHLLRPENFGLEVRERNGEEYVVRM